MGEYLRVFPYFGEPSGETKYKEEELMSPMLMDKVSNNLFIIHNLAFHNMFIINLQNIRDKNIQLPK